MRRIEGFQSLRTFRLLTCLLPSVFAVFLYANTLRNGYTYDDVQGVEKNDLIQKPGGWGKILTSNYWGQKANCGLYRPATILSFKIVRILGGPSAWPQHLINILLHALNTLLVLILFRGILPGRAAPFLGALLFASHPIHVEAVAPCVGRSELLACSGVLVALLLFVRGRAVGCMLLAAGLAFFSKEHSLALVGILTLAQASQGWKGLKDQWKGLLGLALLAGFFLLARTLVFRALSQDPSFPVHQIHATDNPFVLLSIFHRWGAAVSVLGRYVQLLVLPIPLCSNYASPSLAAEMSTISFYFALGALFHVFLCALLLIQAWRRSPSLLAAAMYLGFLFPVSNLLVLIGTPMAERILYLPSVGFIGLLVGWVFRPRVHLLKGALFAGLTILLIFFSIKTPLRNRQWRDNKSLFSQDVQICPDSFTFHAALGEILLKEGRLQEAERELLEAIRIDPKASAAYNQLSMLTFLQGRPRLSLDYLKKAQETSNGGEETLGFNFGKIYLRLGEYAAAETSLRQALEKMPCQEGHLMLAKALMAQGKEEEARLELEKAQSAPTPPNAESMTIQEPASP